MGPRLEQPSSCEGPSLLLPMMDTGFKLYYGQMAQPRGSQNILDQQQQQKLLGVC